MMAAVHERYGRSDEIDVIRVATPVVGPGTAVVRVSVAALNPLDWHLLTGTPWLVRPTAGFLRPRSRRVGVDVAGTVVAVGPDVDGVRVGDRVVGVAPGACAQYVKVPTDRLAPIPDGLAPEQAVGAGVAAVTALQGLRDKGGVEAGHRVLINGASGGVGSAAVQLAVWLGAEVTAVCSTRNVELVRSLGAQHVVDYRTDDFAATDDRYDVFFDNQGNRPVGVCRGLLADDGVYVPAGGPKDNVLWGPMGRVVWAMLRSIGSSRRVRPFVASERSDDLGFLLDRLAEGSLRTVIDTDYPLAEIRSAMDHLAGGHARGKILVRP